MFVEFVLIVICLAKADLCSWSKRVQDRIQASIADHCPTEGEDGRGTSFVSQQSGFEYRDQSKVVVPLAMHQYTLVVWPFLAAVFLVSFVFQASRTAYTMKSLWFKTCPKLCPKSFSAVKTDIQREERPDFLRWTEYALTSPLQVFVVATSFWIGEMDLLLCMCALQGALMFMGYLLELEIDVVITRLYASDKSQTETGWLWRARLVAHVVFLFFSACFFHGVVWWVVIHRFYSQARNASVCMNPMPPGIKTLVEIIVFVEFSLFTCFGLVMMWQICRVVVKVYTLNNLDDGGDFRNRLWVQATAWYHVLSFAAKSLLGILFIMLVRQMPAATVVPSLTT